MEEPPPSQLPPAVASPDPADLEAVFQALEEMLSSSHPEVAAFLEESLMGQCEPSGSEPVSVAVEERTSPGNMSCGNNSLEPEGPDVHLLYLSRRAALRGRKLVRSRPGPALAGDDGCSSAGPCPDHDHHELLVNLKSLMREKVAAGVEVHSHSPSHFQQQLGTASNGDLLQSPSTLGKANRPGGAQWSLWGYDGFESGMAFENWYSSDGGRLALLADGCSAQFTQYRTKIVLQEGISAATTLQNCSVPNPVTGSAGSTALTNNSGSDFQGEVRLDTACQVLEEMLSCNPEMAAFLEESLMGQCEPSGSEPVRVMVEERTSPGNVSCGNNSLEPEGPSKKRACMSLEMSETATLSLTFTESGKQNSQSKS